MGEKISAGMGVGPVRYNAVDADLYRSFGFPGADEMGNMFQMYRDFAKEVPAARSVDVARQLNPQLQNFDQFLAKNKSKVDAGDESRARGEPSAGRVGRRQLTGLRTGAQGSGAHPIAEPLLLCPAASTRQR